MFMGLWVSNCVAKVKSKVEKTKYRKKCNCRQEETKNSTISLVYGKKKVTFSRVLSFHKDTRYAHTSYSLVGSQSKEERREKPA